MASSQAGAEQETSSRPGGRSSPGLLIDYWRAELAVLQSRLDRTDAKAGGIVAGCVGVAGAAATGIAALGEDLGAVSIAVVSVGGLTLFASALRAMTARDTSDRAAWWWKLVTVSILKRGERTQAVLDARRDLKSDPIAFDPASSADAQTAIASSLRARAIAAQHVADYTDKQVADASTLLFFGVTLTTVGVVLVIVNA